MQATETRRILRLQSLGSQPEVVDDTVATESAVHLFINGVHWETIMCTPQRLEDLVTGHLLSDGIIDQLYQLTAIRFVDQYKCEVTLVAELNLEERLATRFFRAVPSGFQRRTQLPTENPTNRLMPLRVIAPTVIDASAVQRAANALNNEASIYRKTGGVHAASVCRKDGILEHLAEDVGRHNAVDKAVGSCARSSHSFEDRFLISTGRLTGDMILKAARVNIPVVASISAVVTSGIDVAEKTDVTAIGFVRGERMNIYSHSERISYA